MRRLERCRTAASPCFGCFAEACKGLDVQLVVSHGGGLSQEQASALPGNPLVVGYAPQEDLLSRAALTVTHAGLNTVLDSLAHGVPLVTIPITYEQPAIARRVERAGSGRVVPLAGMSSGPLGSALRDVLGNPHYRVAASRIGEAIRRAGGVKRAADLTEAATR